MEIEICACSFCHRSWNSDIGTYHEVYTNTQHSIWSELLCLTKKLEGSRHYVFSNLTLFWHRVPTYDSDRKWRHTSPWKTTGWQDVESTGSKEKKKKSHSCSFLQAWMAFHVISDQSHTFPPSPRSNITWNLYCDCHEAVRGFLYLGWSLVAVGDRQHVWRDHLLLLLAILLLWDNFITLVEGNAGNFFQFDLYFFKNSVDK